ncbi:hypothetical protein [Flavobacterium sp. KMS]|jgi:hypothetical protein|uniref:hypothetical protein n=2 Tax=unclassified Flavobacterium TaxID=196869 RepID=UPI00058060B3|nr:hypothetical protein [Flavobacterium sp. KMS]KIA97099.1 hypothetical protein OA93_16080 [Flavobacterium sp. KMS]KIA97978.1 hypothetical protein OA88_20980 [Flavobacterium sp. JRM]
MKTLAYIFLITMILRPVFPVLDYIINYDYIATELCENKNQPELDCKGKCHLKKELGKATEDDSSSSSEKKSFPTGLDLLFLEKINSFNFKLIFKSILKNDILPINLYSHFNIDLIFHPPTLQY